LGEQSDARQIIDRFHVIRELVATHAKAAGRCPAEVKILVASKGRSSSLINALYQEGQVDFGENYWQELQQKVLTCQPLPLRWHFIGRLQSNKLVGLSQSASYIHSVVSIKQAQALSAARRGAQSSLGCFIQVNLSGNTRKGGVSLKDVIELCHDCVALPHLQLCGLMTMLDIEIPIVQRRAQFDALRQLRDRVEIETGIKLPELSMGMSDDFKEAIACGATWLRLGRGIFEAGAGE
jgi:pyridoxal phosphate enzyme (YggS family)